MGEEVKISILPKKPVAVVIQPYDYIKNYCGKIRQVIPTSTGFKLVAFPSCTTSYERKGMSCEDFIKDYVNANGPVMKVKLVSAEFREA